MNLLLVHTTPGLREMLEAAYEGVAVVSVGTSLRLAEDSLPAVQAVYLEDTVDNLAAVRNFIARAASRGVRVLVGLHGLGVSTQHDFARTGLAITLEREPAALSAWIARELGCRRRRELARALIGISTAKGGAGKTTVAVNLARALALRGLKVLLMDGDMANAGVVRALKIPGGFPSYLRLVDDHENWSPDTIRHLVLPHASGFDLLLGSATPADRLDFRQAQWEALFAGVRALDDWDAVLIDTGPDLTKRPFILDILDAGGLAVIPCMPMDEDVDGAWDALHFIETDNQADLTSRAFVQFVAPERGIIPTITEVQPLLAQRFPRARFLPVWPRATYQLSLASVLSKKEHRYMPPLDVLPASPYSRAVHRTAEALIRELGLQVPAPMPAFGFWQRLMGSRQVAVPQA